MLLLPYHKFSCGDLFHSGLSVVSIIELLLLLLLDSSFGQASRIELLKLLRRAGMVELARHERLCDTPRWLRLLVDVHSIRPLGLKCLADGRFLGANVGVAHCALFDCIN